MPIETSPFVFDAPLPPGDLAGRHEELATLRDRAMHGRFCVLSAPRRYGKTSLLARLASDAAVDRCLIVVRLDLLGILTFDDLTRRFASGLAAIGERKVAAAAQRALAAVADAGVRVAARKVGIDLGAGIIRPDDTPPAATLEAILGVPVAVAKRTGSRVLVVLDEFQAIADIDRADAIVRSQIQHQREHVSYLFSGSEQGVLRSLFGARSAPLYGQAEMFDLGPLSAETAFDYVAARFEATNRTPGVAIGALVDTAAGHPQRLNLLAHHLWNNVAEHTAADLDSWTVALDAAIRAIEPELVAIWTTASTSQRRLLRLAAWGQPPSGAAARRLSLIGGAATSAKRTLIETSVLHANGTLIDPLLGVWLRRQHPAA